MSAPAQACATLEPFDAVGASPPMPKSIGRPIPASDRSDRHPSSIAIGDERLLDRKSAQLRDLSGPGEFEAHIRSGSDAPTLEVHFKVEAVTLLVEVYSACQNPGRTLGALQDLAMELNERLRSGRFAKVDTTQRRPSAWSGSTGYPGLTKLNRNLTVRQPLHEFPAASNS